MKINIPFGSFTPDSPAYENTGLMQAKNILPMRNHYLPLKNLAAYSNALGDRARGACSTIDAAGNVSIFVGDSSKLYKMDTSSLPNFTDLSKEGGYTTAEDGLWKYAQFGNHLLATNFIDPIQIMDLNDGNAFLDLAGTPPKARHIAVIGNFVVTGNTWDSTDGYCPYRVRWSAINNAENWDISATTQADFQDLQDEGGWIQAVVGGEYGVIIKERSIWRMSYIGSPLVFQFELVEKNRGTKAPNSVQHIGNLVFYLDESGFFVFDGNASRPIGAGRIDEFFYDDLDVVFAPRISSAIDPVRKLVLWAYPGKGNVNGEPNKLLIYNWEADLWSYGEMPLEHLFSCHTVGMNLESLDDIATNIEALPFSLDSRVWTGGSSFLGAFSLEHKLCFFDGESLPALIETGEISSDGKMACLQRVCPIIDGGDLIVQTGARNTLQEEVTWSLDIPVEDSGEAYCRSNARYHRLRFILDRDWKSAQGTEAYFKNGGRR
ncbi:MAG: hypothetical protein ACTSXQ_00300 [Alphaproteobacteria bacterium]